MELFCKNRTNQPTNRNLYSEQKMPPVGIFFIFGWGALNSLGIKCLRGIPDDLIARCLSNLLIVEPATGVADYEPWPRSILKRPKKGRLNLGCGVWAKLIDFILLFYRYITNGCCIPVDLVVHMSKNAIPRKPDNLSWSMLLLFHAKQVQYHQHLHL